MRRFQIVVRRWLYFQREIADLGPQYFSCTIGGSLSCSAPKADPRRGCPNCDYTRKYRYFERDCEKDFRKGLKDSAEGRKWPLKLVMGYVGTIAKANGQTKRGYHPRWSVLTSRLVGIYREEISRVRFVDQWNQRQEMEAMMAEFKAGRAGRGSRREEDDGVE